MCLEAYFLILNTSSVMIAHRLKTVRNADQIVVIDNKFFLCYYEGGKRKESK